jgi:hypothetical protein
MRPIPGLETNQPSGFVEDPSHRGHLLEAEFRSIIIGGDDSWLAPIEAAHLKCLLPLGPELMWA